MGDFRYREDKFNTMSWNSCASIPFSNEHAHSLQAVVSMASASQPCNSEADFASNGTNPVSACRSISSDDGLEESPSLKSPTQ